MASDDETMMAMAKLTLRNRLLVDILFGITNDFAYLIEPSLERCAHHGCRAAATVNQVDLKVHMCDYHASAAIVRAQTNALADLQDPLTLVRARMADEECWVDLPRAPQIRRIEGYVSELRKNDEPDPPANPVECH